ncbi:MAG TPA: hypothetical protein VFS02_03680 [Telluria sp.]|nr:hypothetical protein [Telluria sp.]
MFPLHCTQKLLVRIKQPTAVSLPMATTALGNSYVTALMWKPQVALFVNESTRLPLFMPLARLKTLAARFIQLYAEIYRFFWDVIQRRLNLNRRASLLF